MILATPVAISPTYVLIQDSFIKQAHTVTPETHINWSLFYAFSSPPHRHHSKGEDPEAGVVIKKPVLVSECVRGAYDGCRGK